MKMGTLQNKLKGSPYLLYCISIASENQIEQKDVYDKNVANLLGY